MALSFRPSAKLSLTCRFEDFGKAVVPTPKKTTIRLKGAKDTRGDLKVVQDPDAPAGTARFLLVDDTPLAAANNAAIKPGDPWAARVSHILPLTATWKVTSPRLGRTLSVKLRWDDFPLDPRCVRSLGVEYYLGTVSPEDFSAGVAGFVREPGVPYSIVPDRWVDKKGRLRSNLRFRGWVDKMSTGWEDGQPTVEFECSDNTRLLINQKAPPKLSVAMDKPIDEAIAQYLSHFPQLAGLRVEYRPLVERTAEMPPRLKVALAGSAFRPDVGPPVSKGGGSDDGNSVWDYLATICGSLAHQCYIEEDVAGTVLVVGRGTAVVDKRVLARTDETYIQRAVDGRTYDVRTLVYNNNLDKLHIEREFVRKAAVNIEVRCVDPHRKTVLVARFPEKADRVSHALPADGKADQMWRVMHVQGVRDQDTLKKIAEEVYNSIGRNEVEVNLKTRDLCSYGGDENDPDLLDLRNGDPLRLVVAMGGSATGEVEQLFGSPAGVERQMLDRGFSQAFASAYARSYSEAAFQTIFRTKEATISWDHEKGVDVEMVAGNYIEARVDRPNITEQEVRGVKKPKK